MHTRFGRIAIAWALVLMTVWLGDRLYRSYVDVADEPKRVTPGGTLSDWESSNIELFQAAGASVAYITTEQVRFTPFRGASVVQGAGSGFIWDQAGHVVINFHVIEGADIVYVELSTGDPMPARVIGGTPEYDIAVVRLRNPPRDLQPLPIGTSKSRSVGQATLLRRRALELTWPLGDEEASAALAEFKEHAAGTLLALDLTGTFVFALSGAAARVKERRDLFGVLVLSFAAASSGGMLRDLLLAQVLPVLRSELYAVAALAARS